MSTLHPDVMLEIQLSAAMSRNQYIRDAQPIIDEVRQIAGGRPDILHRQVGIWVGYHGIPENAALTSALLDAFPGAVPFIREGQARRGRGSHSTPSVRTPKQPPATS
ncbi:MAG: hypothetical protein K0S70_2088 [Microbacterium sp.]|jgi:hypothetical protein|nr:hypothetical protein [Microbacterium sp.]